MQIVEENKVITITYELKENDQDGELMERMDANYPFVFLFGTGTLLPAFERELEGLTEKDGFEFILKCREAYGEVKEENIVNVPRAVFQIEGAEPPNLIVENNYVALTDDHNETHHGKILDFNNLVVRVDFNHVMAGKNLYFKGAILNIRKATVDEIINQHHLPMSGVRG